MARKTQFTCDGCGEQKLMPTAKDKPDDWKTVTITWAGLGGYPANKPDGTGVYDLCKSCAVRMAEDMNPHNWVRLSKSVLGNHIEEGQS